MADFRVVIYSLIGLGLGIFLFFKGFSWFRMKRMIENIPTSKVRSIAMGLVELFGEVTLTSPETVLKSPLTNSKCVYYNYCIQEERGSGKNRHWVTIKSGTNKVHFYLKDNTGKVLVDPDGAQIDIPADFKFQSSWGKDPPESVKGFLKRNNLSFETFLGMNKNMKYTEWFIAPKDKLYILGHAGDNPYVEEATAQHSVEDIMIQKGGEKIYYISDKSEADVLKSFRWKVIGGFFGGGVLIVGCLAVILLYFGVS
ncbi:E3 ubiquitin ligase family protein [Candidatus Woesearchaeota archaeon]|nr:E3 ubiquitin ligase family protein [Candidatus Woesearchaeota archaeon]